MFQNRHTRFSHQVSRIVLALCCGMASVLPLHTQADTVPDTGLADALAYVEKQPLAASVLAALPQNRVVFVGEIHDRYDHHLNQLAVLQALHQKNPNIAIGVEWFQQPFQGAVNDFLAGKIDETAFLRQSEYYERWGYDFRQLRPILAYAKANRLPVVALNAPVELTRKVSKGGLEALTATERAQLPAVIHPPSAAYRQQLKKIFAVHSDDKQQFENFLLVQRIWEETMAQQAVRYLEKHPQHQMVVLAGVGHISNDAGIPADVARHMPQAKLLTLASSDIPALPSGTVDQVLASTSLTLPPSGKLGVLLDTQDNGLHITALDKNSAASKAGLQQGDRLARVDNQELHTMADLKLALAQRQVGDAVQVAVERGGAKAPLAYTVVLQ
jgi:uncharacterized iron-regulated protein